MTKHPVLSDKPGQTLEDIVAKKVVLMHGTDADIDSKNAGANPMETGEPAVVTDVPSLRFRDDTTGDEYRIPMVSFDAMSLPSYIEEDMRYALVYGKNTGWTFQPVFAGVDDDAVFNAPSLYDEFWFFGKSLNAQYVWSGKNVSGEWTAIGFNDTQQTALVGTEGGFSYNIKHSFPRPTAITSGNWNSTYNLVGVVGALSTGAILKKSSAGAGIYEAAVAGTDYLAPVPADELTWYGTETLTLTANKYTVAELDDDTDLTVSGTMPLGAEAELYIVNPDGHALTISGVDEWFGATAPPSVPADGTLIVLKQVGSGTIKGVWDA